MGARAAGSYVGMLSATGASSSPGRACHNTKCERTRQATMLSKKTWTTLRRL